MHGLFLLLFLSVGKDAVSRIPIPALAGVTAYVGICLLEWSTWRRLPKLRRVDAAAFLSTAICTLFFNAIAAVAIGCGMYGIRWIVERTRAAQPGHGQLAPAEE